MDPSMCTRQWGTNEHRTPHSLYSSSSNGAQGTYTSVLHHFRLFHYVTLVVFYYLLDPRYRRSYSEIQGCYIGHCCTNRMLGRWRTVTGPLCRVVYDETWKDNPIHCQRRRQYCGENVLVKMIWWHFDIAAVNIRSVQYNIIYKGRCSRDNLYTVHTKWYAEKRCWLISLM